MSAHSNVPGADPLGRTPTGSIPTSAQRRRWAQYLVDERAEAQVYLNLAKRRTGEERDILLALADAEHRHEAHWLSLLGGEPKSSPAASVRTRMLGVLARRFGSVFVLALAQNAEARSPYDDEPAATEQMRADEKVHHEVVRELAAKGRRRLSGTFRAAVFGANDGLVSNFALILGIGAAGVAPNFVLLSGIAGLLAGALSMAAGEFISVRSQRELLEATEPGGFADASLHQLDLEVNELSLVYRARGMGEEEALRAAHTVIEAAKRGTTPVHAPSAGHEVVGGAWRAAISSFLFFASGAVIPVIPWLFGLGGSVAILISLVLVGLSLMATGATVGLLSGGSPLKRALRQLAIGYGAAAVTYVLGLAFGVSAA